MAEGSPTILDLPPLRGNPFDLRPIESSRAGHLVGRDPLLSKLRGYLISTHTEDGSTRRPERLWPHLFHQHPRISDFSSLVHRAVLARSRGPDAGHNPRDIGPYRRLRGRGIDAAGVGSIGRDPRQGDWSFTAHRPRLPLSHRPQLHTGPPRTSPAEASCARRRRHHTLTTLIPQRTMSSIYSMNHSDCRI